MNRPVYETSRNVSHEERIAERLASLWDTRLFKTPKLYPYDYCAEDRKGSGDVVAIIEIKRRHITFGFDRRGIVPFISLHKVAEMLRYSKTFGLRPLLVFGFNNCIAYTDLSRYDREERLSEDFSGELAYRIAEAGRTKKTRSEGDVEPMLFIHPMQWIVVEEINNEEWYDNG